MHRAGARRESTSPLGGVALVLPLERLPVGLEKQAPDADRAGEFVGGGRRKRPSEVPPALFFHCSVRCICTDVQLL